MEQAIDTKPNTTLADYFDLEETTTSGLRHEYHGDGRIVPMSGGSANHSRIGTNVSREMSARLPGRPCEAFNSDMRFSVKRSGRYYYPDASAACGPVEFDRQRGQESLVNPQLVVEVLSPSTERIDRNSKFDDYMLIDSLREYVLIEQDEARAIVFSRHDDGSRRIATFVGIDATLILASVGIEIPLRAIYQNVELPPMPIVGEPIDPPATKPAE